MYFVGYVPTGTIFSDATPDRFIMPGAAEEPMADSPWYGFDFGPVHFTVMSTEHDFSPGSKQVYPIRSSRIDTPRLILLLLSQRYHMQGIFRIIFIFCVTVRLLERVSQNRM